MKLKAIVSAALAAGAMASANAFVIFPGLTQLEDDNREYLIKGAGNTNASVLEVGDRLRGVIKFQAIVQLEAPFQSDNAISPEITGVFETEVANIVDANGDGIAEVIAFAPSAAFQATYGAGATVALYTGGTTLDINACPSIAVCEANATTAGGGALWAVVGFGDTDDQWVSVNSLLNFGLVQNTGGTTQVSGINYSQSILQNNTGYLFNEIALDCGPGQFTCAGDGKTDLVGSGSILGGRGLTNGYGARSDIDVTLYRVPEPGALALTGIALAGLGLFSRRKAKAAA